MHRAQWEKALGSTCSLLFCSTQVMGSTKCWNDKTVSLQTMLEQQKKKVSLATSCSEKSPGEARPPHRTQEGGGNDHRPAVLDVAQVCFDSGKAWPNFGRSVSYARTEQSVCAGKAVAKLCSEMKHNLRSMSPLQGQWGNSRCTKKSSKRQHWRRCH